MKKIIYICLAALVGLGACSEDNSFTLDASEEYFSFTAKSISVMGDGSAVTATVEWAKVTPREGNLELEIVTDGFENPAVEGVDYTISSKTVSFGSAEYSKTITITPMNNSTMNGNRTFIIKMKGTNTSSKFGFSSRDEDDQITITNNQITVTVIDPESALTLADILGDYTQVDYLEEDGQPEKAPYTTSIAATSNPNEVTLVNFWGYGKSIVAEIDILEYSIAILPGQVVYDRSAPSGIATYLDFNLMQYSSAAKIEGSISLDGRTITFGNPATGIGWGVWAQGTSGSFYEFFSHTVLTKQ